jgi:hypothetical protein
MFFEEGEDMEQELKRLRTGVRCDALFEALKSCFISVKRFRHVKCWIKEKRACLFHLIFRWSLSIAWSMVSVQTPALITY